jgi:hypothetical protein
VEIPNLYSNGWSPSRIAKEKFPHLKAAQVSQFIYDQIKRKKLKKMPTTEALAVDDTKGEKESSSVVDADVQKEGERELDEMLGDRMDLETVEEEEGPVVKERVSSDPTPIENARELIRLGLLFVETTEAFLFVILRLIPGMSPHVGPILPDGIPFDFLNRPISLPPDSLLKRIVSTAPSDFSVPIIHDHFEERLGQGLEYFVPAPQTLNVAASHVEWFHADGSPYLGPDAAHPEALMMPPVWCFVEAPFALNNLVEGRMVM